MKQKEIEKELYSWLAGFLYATGEDEIAEHCNFPFETAAQEKRISRAADVVIKRLHKLAAGRR